MKLAAGLAIPIMIIVLGVLSLLGCIRVPATGQLQPNWKPRPEFAIGTTRDKPIRLGQTRVDDAFVELNRQVQTETGHGWTDLRSAAETDSKWMILNRWRV